jgi:putative SbcD/Mre11-related phosphoesterase
MIVLNEWLLTAQRVAVHAPTATAVAADLHLGYDLSRRKSGDAVPDVSVDEALSPLALACERTSARRVVIAGDLLEDGGCAEVLQCFLHWLRRAGLELAGVVPGNHDLWPAVSWRSAGVDVFPGGIVLGRWTVVHGHGPMPEGRVAQGHEHPVFRLRRGVAAPCFLVAEDRLVLPAYSADAAGVNVLCARRWRNYRACVVAGERVLDFGPLADLRRRLG